MINGHGDDIYKYRDIQVNFSSNIYMHFDHEGLFCHLANTIDNVVNYPEPSPLSLEMELSGMIDVKPEEVMVTNGATEAIYLIAQTFRHAESAIVQPTFAEYADACRIHEHEIRNIHEPLTIPYDCNMVWLCNPNNPTGSVLEKDFLLELIAKNPDALFVIDASYASYTDKELITPKEAVTMPNVLMLHSMTKEFAIPGLRLGYVTANETLLQQVRLQRMPWSVNQVAIDAGHYLLMHQDEYTLDLKTLLMEKERMLQKLKSLGVIDVWPSDTNILLCKLRFGNAPSLKDYLAREHGILIRDASNFDGLDQTYFRIAVQTPEEDDLLINAIIEWLAQ